MIANITQWVQIVNAANHSTFVIQTDNSKILMFVNVRFTINHDHINFILFFFTIHTECDCDPRGSEDQGQCDAHTDVASGMEAGRCHCKPNVEGRRCDHCKAGFWNLQELNLDGCEGMFYAVIC